ncbi:MAG: helix-turn-helix transcriptional regulator [Armatimonadetes bacterium]|nr:helix-turn-helix transcriptional regulator [Armatimonadota bacterium]MDW8152680.1 helix-turn-helix domain-containing protein [Armatimonadota bacterium]
MRTVRDRPTAHVCPRFHRAIELIGKRWTGAIVQTLMEGSRRFTELLEAVPGLHDRLLSERPRELEAEEMVERRADRWIPLRPARKR